ncbi:MAG TPA: YgjP-like metallopeptidase domain-containing protein, partial [Sphingomonas sp.]|nr:YgjP-like metallopeptidase domain-containing protein [Sphingomonas sp.]
MRLTIPPRASLKQAMAWANDHRGWIDAQRAKLPQGRPFAPGAIIPIEGEDVVIDWSPERSRTVQLAETPSPFPLASGSRAPSLSHWEREGAPEARKGEGDPRLICGGPLEGLPRRIETWLKRRALAILTEETAEFAAKAGVTVSRVTVADPKGRWGSCASTGAIRYSWRLICAPPHVRRSTVAHEVAHRLHMDHSPAFHAAYRQLLGAD